MENPAATTAQGAAAQQAAALQGKKIFGLKIPKLPKLPKQLGFLANLWPFGGEATPGGESSVPATVAGAMVNAGQDVTLTWDTSHAGTLTIDKIVGGQTQFVATIDKPLTQRQYAFKAETRERATYVLTARNWINRLPFVGNTFGMDEARVALIVDPVQPVINVFDVTPPSIVTGQKVNIAWDVAKAQQLSLLVNQVPRPLQDMRGAIEDAPNTTTEYKLEATSPYWDQPVDSPPHVVTVNLPTPVIRAFDIAPKPIIDGNIISVSWQVEGASSVSIDPIPGAVPNMQGQDQGVLQPGKSQQTFTLLASVGDPPNQVEAKATRLVDIVTPTPTPTPTFTPTPTPSASVTPLPPPIIKSFDVAPKPIVDGENVIVNWSVDSATTLNINPLIGAVPNLEGQSEIKLPIGKSQETFILQAINSDNIRTVEVLATRVVPIVTPTPTITPTPTPSPTLTPQTPTIQVFTLVPNSVVLGDVGAAPTSSANQTPEAATNTGSLPTLTWTVVGDATDIEISSPDFGPVKNLSKTGTLQVPADKTTVYQINVYLGDKIVASATQELTVLLPTPTPTLTPTSPPPPPPPTATPTLTPTPAPNVVSFAISAVNNPGDVVLIPSPDEPTYQVNAGTSIKFSWNVVNAQGSLKIIDNLNNVYTLNAAQGELALLATQTAEYTLVAAPDTDQYNKRVRLVVIPLPVPPSPQNVSGVDGADETQPSTVTWDYPQDSQSSILGFRIYRAAIDTFNFTMVVDYTALDPAQRAWVDPITKSCNYAYYVVAVYRDITRPTNDQILETPPSPSSWYTKPCK